MALQPVDITDSVGTNFAAVLNQTANGGEYSLIVRNMVSAANFAFICSQVPIGTTNPAVKISNGAPYSSRRLVKLKNGGATTVFLNTSNAVTTSNGYALFAGESEEFEMGPALTIYGISGSTGNVVYVMELG
jgi:hypothetical protein